MGNKNTIVIEHINAQSLLCHFDEIKLLIKEREIDVLCISETWLDESINDSVVNIQDFNIYRNDKGRGGGTCIYVRDDLLVNRIIFDVDNRSDVDIEDVWLSLQYKKFKSFIVGSIYRHPHAKIGSFDYLKDIFRIACLRNKSLYIFGDMNDNLLDENSRLNKVIKSSKLSQMINKPTRVTPNTATLLDPIITNNPQSILDVDVIPGPIADHDLVTARISYRKPKRIPKVKTFRSLRNYSQNKLCNMILNEVHSLNEMFRTDDVNNQVEIFTEILYYCINTCAPTVTKVITRPNAPWINDDIKESINKRNELQKLLKKDRSNTVLQHRYKEIKKLVKRTIETSKQEYFRQKLIDTNKDMKSKWKLIKSLTPNMDKTKETSSFENIKEKIEEFNSYFSNVGKVAYEKSQANANNQDEYIN
ncbi:MAG: endonuclease/exonuclease/phosphatase family protein, partial [Bacteroidota bacterium]